MTAEISSALLVADLGLELTPREDHASYIDSWLKVLKDDKKAIFTAARHAEKAATYLHGLQPKIEAPSPALSDAPTATLELPALPLPIVEPEPPASPLALVVNRPEKPDGFVEKERKRRQVKVAGQTELF